MRTVFVTLSLASFATILTGCALLTSLSGPKKPTYDPRPLMCQVFVPIHWSPKDTDDTIKEIKAHNAVWLDVCGPIVRPPEGALPAGR